MDLIIRPSSNDTIAIALGGKLKGIKAKNSWVTLYLYPKMIFVRYNIPLKIMIIRVST